MPTDPHLDAPDRALADDTIYALASAPGRAGVAVFRVSGPRAGTVLDALTGSDPAARPAAREAVLRRIISPKTGAAFDQGLALWFPGPASFTGEDVVELHLHGGPAVAAAAAAALSAAGARPARPGEFSRRAFAAGKLDLTQAEAIADLVDAESEAQRAQALRQLDGALGAAVEVWRDQLLAAMALVEAEIDFPDEDDVPGGVASRAEPAVDALLAALREHLDDQRRGERVRDGVRVAIIGAPNVGKSSLLNRLAGREAAIVADAPGTTRDVVEVHLALAGQLVVLADTAGLRDAGDEVEAEGVRRARAHASAADLRLGVVDAADPASISALDGLLQSGDLVWVNKTDRASALASAQELRARLAGFHVERDAVDVRAGSALTGDGLDALETAIAGRVTDLSAASDSAPLTRARHRDAMARAVEALERGRARLRDGPELAGEDLRLAARALGEITGRVDVEDVLDRVFADFCIGK